MHKAFSSTSFSQLP